MKKQPPQQLNLNAVIINSRTLKGFFISLAVATASARIKASRGPSGFIGAKIKLPTLGI
jgi:hypothetical protein